MAQRIFLIADFKDESPKSIRISQRMWHKGLIRAGCDVQRFSYRNTMTQLNPFGWYLRRLAPKSVKRRADEILAEQIKKYYPDIVFILSMKYLDRDTVQMIRDIRTGVFIVGRDEDAWPEKKPERVEVARLTDLVINTSAGRFLQFYKDSGVKKCAFFPNICDPDIQYRYEVEPQWQSNIIFTGRAVHKRFVSTADRLTLIEKIAQMPFCRVYGSFGYPRVEGLDYFYALSGTKIALSNNAVNDVELYHSDRLINSLSCGPFVLAKRVPQTELLHQDGQHLRYFDTEGEFFELADWYLKHDDERQKIAQAGMEHAHKEYNCTRMAKLLLDFIETGDYNAPWRVIL